MACRLGLELALDRQPELFEPLEILEQLPPAESSHSMGYRIESDRAWDLIQRTN